LKKECDKVVQHGFINLRFAAKSMSNNETTKLADVTITENRRPHEPIAINVDWTDEKGPRTLGALVDDKASAEMTTGQVLTDAVMTALREIKEVITSSLALSIQMDMSSDGYKKHMDPDKTRTFVTVALNPTISCKHADHTSPGMQKLRHDLGQILEGFKTFDRSVYVVYRDE
jgi:hypothetical protein